MKFVKDILLDKGDLIVNTNDQSNGLFVTRWGTTSIQYLKQSVGDGLAEFYYKNDEISSSIKFTIQNTDTETGSGAGANTHTFVFLGSNTGAELRIDGSKVWHQGNDGHGSGLDADTIDGLHADAFLRADTGGQITGNVSATSVSSNDSGALHLPIVGGGGFATNTDTVTGAIKITLPQSWTNTMLRFAVDIFEYETGESFTVYVAGYNYAPSPQWINTSAYVLAGNTNRNFTVRFGHDGSKCCVYIGELTSTWSYPQIRVRDFVAGYGNYNASMWSNGWSISFESVAFGTISSTITNTLVISSYALNADKLDGIDSTGFLRRNTDTDTTGKITITRDGDAIVFNKNSGASYSGLLFTSRVNSGSDYAYIRYYDDVSNFYAPYDNGGNSENSALVIGVENDGVNISNDYLVLRGPTKIILDAFASSGSSERVAEFRKQGTVVSHIDNTGKYNGDVSSNQVEVKSTSTSNKFVIDFNETENSLDFIYT